jgi:hypothetical protein
MINQITNSHTSNGLSNYWRKACPHIMCNFSKKLDQFHTIQRYTYKRYQKISPLDLALVTFSLFSYSVFSEGTF